MKVREDVHERQERLERTLRSFLRATEKLTEGLEAWHREKTPHTEERLTHYYLVFKDCNRNLRSFSEAMGLR